MFDAHALFKQRLSDHIKELSRYLRYIFNGHMAVAMLFMISASAVFYQQWIAQLSADFPAVWIIAIIFGGLITYSPVRTLLKEPDLVFLIAAEEKMSAYFRNAILYSFVSQLYLVLLAGAVLGPLYFHAFPNQTGLTYLLILVVLLIVKAWNMLASWWVTKVRDQTIRTTNYIIRFILNVSIFYFMMMGNTGWGVISNILFIGFFLYTYTISKKQVGLAWELLVEKEHNKMQAFYQMANMFTDVPHLKKRLKKRKLLVAMFSKWIPFAKRHSYDYLYRITFIRSGDYLGMFIRLIVLGSLFIYFVPNEWLKLIFALLFIYMSLFQLMTLYYHYRTNIWIDLYPLSSKVRKQSLIKLLYQLSFVQIIIYALIFISIQNYLFSLFTFIGGSLFVYIFMTFYVRKKLQ